MTTKVSSPPRAKGQHGQALIELAFVLPVIFVFLLVLVDFGIAIDRREVLQHAVREGARRAAVTTDTTNIIDTTVDQSQGILAPADISVCYVNTNGDGTVGNAGDGVRVSAIFTYEFTAGGGELLSAWNVPVPSIDMTPHGEARLELSVPGATSC